MSDDITKKITIDVEIDTGGQQQITQYRAAFNNLRISINSIKSPLNDISNDIKTLNKNTIDIGSSLDKLNKTAASFNSTGGKIGGIVNTAIGSFSGLKMIVQAVSGTFGVLEAEITGGLSLLISFLPVIIDWVSDLFNADTTTKSLNQTLKEHKAAIEAVRQAQLQGAQDAQGELTNLKLLYNASQDHNLSLAQRKKVVQELQSQYPAYFGNLSQEAILTGKAAGQYKQLTQYIIAAAQARAAQDMIVKNSQRQLDDKDRVDDLTKQKADLQSQINSLEKQYRDKIKKSDRGRGGTDDNLQDQIQQDRDALNDLQKQLYDASNDSVILDQKNAALAETAVQKTHDFGVGVLDGMQSTADQGSEIIGSSSKIAVKAINKETAAYQALKEKKDEVNDKSDNKTNEPAQPKFPVHQSKTDDPNAIPSDIQAASDAEQDERFQKMKQKALQTTQDIIAGANAIKAANEAKEDQERQDRDKKRVDEAQKVAEQIAGDALSVLQNSIKQQADAKVAALEKDKAAELSNTSLTSTQKAAIQQKFQQEEAQVKAKAFKEEQELNIAQAIMNGALAITKVTAQDGVLAALEIGGIVAETAAQVAKIASQKAPAYASGGLHYASDGLGGVLPGYSRTDNTNAFLRSGEGIVVSEAMRAPWARNLVSAINVGFGGRDFSTTTMGNGFAVGGIFTDGGNANRYYNQPVNDNKNLANTIAYQMINNFPPVYVDVKDINNQQNILAQTINRVNL